MAQSTPTNTAPGGSASRLANKFKIANRKVIKKLSTNKPLLFAAVFGLVGVIGLALSLAAVRTTTFNGTVSQDQLSQSYSYTAQQGSLEASLSFSGGGNGKGNGKGKNSYAPNGESNPLTQAFERIDNYFTPGAAAAPPAGKGGGNNKEKPELALAFYDKDNKLVKYATSTSSFGFVLPVTTQTYRAEVSLVGNTYATPVDFTLDITLTTQDPDTTKPTISITTPVNNSTVSGTITIAGTASDNTSLSHVTATINDQPIPTPVSGTTSWSTSLNTTDYPNNTYTIRAYATDQNSNTQVATTTINIQNGGTNPDPDPDPEPPTGDLTFTTQIIKDALAERNLQHMGMGAATTSSDGATVILTTEANRVRPRLSIKPVSGEVYHVPLEYDNTYGYANAVYTITKDNILHVFGAGLEMVHRRYQLTGTPATKATLLDTTVYGNSDSRVNSIVALKSGAVLMAYHQQGEQNAPQGHTFVYVRPDNTRHVQDLVFMPTRASKGALAQHPADDSIWLFHNADAWGRNGVVHMSETASGIRVNWTDSSFMGVVDSEGYPESENPRLFAAPDPTTGSIAVAFQSKTDMTYYGNIKAARIAIVRVKANSDMSVVLTPSRTERITHFGFSVMPSGAIYVTHPLMEAGGNFTNVRAARLNTDGTWAEADLTDKLTAAYKPIFAVPNKAEVFYHTDDPNSSYDNSKLYIFK